MADTITRKQKKGKIVIKMAPRYCNIFYNNEKTTMEQVLYLLINVFQYKEEDAYAKMMEIHTTGKSNVFVGSKEICEFKKEQTDMERARIAENNLIHTVEIVGN